MSRMPDAGAFKPTPSPTEARNDATTKKSRAITDSEAAARLAKTARLRAARLAHEAGETVAPAPAKQPHGKH